jgi:hypothetical protein
VGGTGGTTYLFDSNLLPSGAVFGSDVIDQPSDTQSDTLDFSQFAGPVTINLGDTSPQIVDRDNPSYLQLTLSNPLGMANVIGNSASDDLTGNARDNQFFVGDGSSTLAGGGGSDSYFFAGTVVGNDEITDTSATDADTLNFLGLDGPATLDLSRTTQAVRPQFNLTLDDPQAVVAVVGTPYADTVLGNSRDDTIIGAGGDDSLVAGSGDDIIQGDITHVVYLDFTSGTAAGAHVFTADEQNAILQGLQADYGDFSYYFTTSLADAERQAAVTGGSGVSIVFNSGPAGGKSDQLDWRDLELGGNTSVNVNPLLGGPGQPPATPGPTGTIVLLSVEIAAHELGHQSGLLHPDSFGPIGGGIYYDPTTGTGVNPDSYSPAYPGPDGATDTPFHIMASPDSVGVTLFQSASTTYFGEREAVKLAFADTGTVVPQVPGNSSPTTAQPIGVLPGLAVPNTLRATVQTWDGSTEATNEPDLGKRFQVRAIDVTGAVTAAAPDDYYSFVGNAGDLMNFQVMSSALTSNAEPFAPLLQVFDAAGNLLASNHGDFESADPSIIDYRLPASGVFYVEVSPNVPLAPGQSEGDYELFLYSFATGPTSLGAGDTLVGGSGNDTLVGSSGNDLFTFVPGASGNATILGGSGNDLVNLTRSPGETIGSQTGTFTVLDAATETTPPVIEQIGSSPTTPGTPVTASVSQGGVLVLPVSVSQTAGDRVTCSLVADATSATGASIDPTTGNLSWVPTSPGNYTVRIQVTDSSGEVATQDVVIAVANVAPSVSLPTSADTTEGGTWSATGSFTDPGINTWTATVDYGDGSGTQPLTLNTDETFALSHVYADEGPSGSYTVTVTVTDNGALTGTATMTVHVADVTPVVQLTNVTAAVTEGGTFTASGSFTDPGDDRWTATVDYGDGTTGPLTLNADKTFALSHVYADESPIGTYTVTVSVSDDHGSTGSVSTQVSVADAPVTDVGVSVTTTSPTEGAPVVLHGSYSDAGAADTHTFHWQVLDGGGRTVAGGGGGPDFSFTPVEEGSYSVFLTVADDHGASGSATTTLTVADPAVLATGGFTVAATEGSDSGLQTVATFTDPGGAEDVGDYSATIDWGDGQTSAGTISLAVGDFTVQGSHRYTEESPAGYPLSVIITHDHAPAVMVTSTATVAEAPVVATGDFTLSGVEGHDSGFQTVATFTDPAGPEAPADYAATIAWGDDSSSSGTIRFDAGTGVFTVLGSHTYAQAGPATITVSIVHETTTVTAASGAAVTDAALQASGQTLTATEGASFSGVVAAFTDADPKGAAGDYTATITWGDHFTSAGNISADGHGGFLVSGSHTYPEEGGYTIGVSIQDAGGSTALANSAMTVKDPPVMVTPHAVQGVEGTNTGLVTLATFTDPGGAEAAADYGATITWGDGQMSAGTVSGPDGSGVFTVEGSHLYAGDGTFSVTVTVSHATALNATAQGTATVSDMAPSVSAASASVSAAENAAATNTGTFADYDDAVTLSASAGTVTQGGGTSGTWTWSGTGEEGAPYTVVITATNADGQSATTSFNVSFTDVAPGVAADHAAVIATEDGSAANSGTFADYDDPVNIMVSQGSVSQVGTTSGTWSWSQAGLDEGTYTVTVTATNADHSVSTTSFTAVVGDAAPSVAAGHASVSAPENGTATNSGTFRDYDDAVTITASRGTVVQSGTQGGSWSWTGTGDDDHPYDVTITATNADGSRAATTFHVSFTDVPPTVTAAGASVSAAENAAATNTGTFADHDDAVAITASQGTVSQDNTAGTWSWSQAGLDEGTYHVTVTATNADGSASSTSFDVVVSDVAPVVWAASASVNAAENGTATNTGTFSDFDDAVTLTASSGTVTQTGSRSGTWSWSGTGDEDHPYTVTVTATNADGSTATTSFNVSFTDVPPTVSAANSSVSAVEGGTARNTGAFTDYDDVVTITASTGTVTQTSGKSGTWSWSQPEPEEGNYTVTITAANADGKTAATSFTVSVADAALSAAGNNVSGTEGTSTGTVTVATFTDLGGAESTSDYTATIDWGDGSAATAGTIGLSGSALSVTGSHTYAEDDTYTVKVHIVHENGITADTSSTATVAPAPIKGTGDTLTPIVARNSFSGEVATFTHAGNSEPASDFTASINWGVGSPTTGTIIFSGGVYHVTGTSPVYTAAGTYTITVTITENPEPNETGQPTTTLTVTGNVFALSHYSGTIFYDTNTTGVRDTGEPAVQGWHILIDGGDIDWNSNDANGTGVDPVYTDSSGNYSFTLAQLPGTTHVISEQPLTNWVRTAGPAGYTIIVGTDQAQMNFGDVKLGAGGALSVGFWRNSNGQGVLRANENANAPVTGTIKSEVQTVKIAGTSGTFSLTFNGQTTAALAYNASAAAVQAALNALTTIGGVGGSVGVTLKSGVYTVTLGGNLSGYDVPQMTAATVTGSPNPSVSTTSNGSGYNVSNWRVILNGLGLRDHNGNLFEVSTTDTFANAFAAFASYLQGATGTNMSYQLSAQLAAMKLNVTMTSWNGFGGVNANSLVYAPGTSSANANGFATVSAVMSEAAYEIATNPVNAKNTPGQYYQGTAGTMPSSMTGSPWGTGSAAVYNYAQALEQALDNANNNNTFVQSPVTMLLTAACRSPRAACSRGSTTSPCSMTAARQPRTSWRGSPTASACGTRAWPPWG